MADLSGADLRMADLSGADLSRADLRMADLRMAFIAKAIFDMTTITLSCKTLGIKVDDRLVEQFLFHIETWDKSDCSPELRKAISRIPKKLRRTFAQRRKDLSEYQT